MKPVCTQCFVLKRDCHCFFSFRCCWNRHTHTNTRRVLMACVKVVIRVKCNIKSAIVRTSTAAILRMRSWDSDKSSNNNNEKKVNSNVYAFIMLSVLVAFCGCASAVGPWIFTYVFINTVSVSFSRSIRNRLSFFAQTHHGTRLLCRQSPPSDGHTIQCVRAIHCSVTQHTKENMIIKNIFVVFFLLWFVAQTAYMLQAIKAHELEKIAVWWDATVCVGCFDAATTAAAADVAVLCHRDVKCRHFNYNYM